MRNRHLVRTRRTPGRAGAGWLLFFTCAQAGCGVLTSGDCAELADCQGASTFAGTVGADAGARAVSDAASGAEVVASGEVRDAAPQATPEASATAGDGMSGVHAGSASSAPDAAAALDAGSSSGASDAVAASDAADSAVVAPPNLCGVPSSTVSSPVLYDGATTAATCPTNIPAPRDGFWFAYNEPNPNDAAAAASALGAMPGCNGPSDCSIHATGSGFTLYAGVGLNLNGGASANTAYDASAYSGIEFWARGVVTGSRAGDAVSGFTPTDQTIFVELVGATGRPMGDEYGAHCVLAADGTSWTHCRVDFAAARRQGLAPPPAGPDAFDRTALYKLQFQFSPFMGTATVRARTVAFDVWIDDVFFY